jgi:hypothetical protein
LTGGSHIEYFRFHCTHNVRHVVKMSSLFYCVASFTTISFTTSPSPPSTI